MKEFKALHEKYKTVGLNDVELERYEYLTLYLAHKVMRENKRK